MPGSSRASVIHSVAAAPLAIAIVGVAGVSQATDEQFGNLFLLYLSSAVRSLALDWNSKLSTRMVAGFAELIEGTRFFGCGGVI